jgi:membrane-bound ClpP family serine protease
MLTEKALIQIGLMSEIYLTLFQIIISIKLKMDKFWNSIISIFLFLLGVYTFWRGLKNKGKEVGLTMSNNRFLLDKLFGKEKTNDILNLFWGSILIVFGIALFINEVLKH